MTRISLLFVLSYVAQSTAVQYAIASGPTNTCSVLKSPLATSIINVMHPAPMSSFYRSIGIPTEEKTNMLIMLGEYVECFPEPALWITPLNDPEIMIESDGFCDNELQELVMSINTRKDMFLKADFWLNCQYSAYFTIRDMNDIKNAVLNKMNEIENIES